MGDKPANRRRRGRVYVTDWRFQVKQETKRGLFASTVLAGLALTMPALAQEPVRTTPAPEPAASEDEDVVVVTGTRLARQDFTAISPVTTVGSQDIELTATLSVETLLNELPQVIPGNTITSNNAGGSNFATVNLRGLGTNRTLVLINGERVPGSNTAGIVDLNTIPAGLLDRIETVTGGASAVYGSDAVAGVINFILKDDYEGGEIRGTVSALDDGNAQENNVDFLVGGNFADGKGNVAIYGSWYNREGVFQSAYPWADTPGAGFRIRSTTAAATDRDLDYIFADRVSEVPTVAAAGTSIIAAGTSASGTGPWGTITNSTTNPFGQLTSLSTLLPAQFGAADLDCNPATPGQAVTTLANGNLSSGTGLSFNNQGQLTPQFVNGRCQVADRAAGSSLYNFNPDNFLIIPAERFGTSAFGTYEINESLTFKFMTSYVNSKTTVQLAATPATGLSVPVSNPFISGADGRIGTADDPAQTADLRAALLSRPNGTANFTLAYRTNSVGFRVSEFENNAFNARGTLIGDLPGGWEWQATAGYGQSRFDALQKNSINRTALLQGLAGCRTTTAGPDLLFGTADDVPTGIPLLPGCAAVDPFGPNRLSAAARSFLKIDTKQFGSFEQTQIGLFARGDLFELPAGPISAVAGFEYREDDAKFVVDDAERQGNIFGFNATQSQAGSIDVYEYYTEVAVPILAELPFVQYLGVEAGFRYSDYSSIGGVETYKIGGEYAPVSWLKFRTVYNEAIRAPSVFELFQNGDQGFANTTDLCRANLAPSAAVQAICLSGLGAPNNVVTPGQLTALAQPNPQIEQFSFGNPNLSQEDAETITAGVVFEPDWLPIGDLKATIDYYDIKITNPVLTRSGNSIVQGCYLTGSAADCARITRDPATGQIRNINVTRGNGGSLKNIGWDAQVDYAFDLDEILPGVPGRLRLNNLYSYLQSFTVNGSQQKPFLAPTVGGATPEWRNVFTLQYEVGDFLFQARNSYTPEMIQAVSALLAVPESPAANYWDLSGRWDVTDRFQLTATVQNVAGDEPPQLGSAPFLGGQANTDVQIYRIGRELSIGGRFKF